MRIQAGLARQRQTGGGRRGGGTVSDSWARHTWATLARELDISADTIGEGLGHRDIHYRVTYLYIRPENKLVDDANRKVIDYINGNLR